MSAYPTQLQFAEQIGTVFSAGAGGAGVTGAPTVEFTLEAVRDGIATEQYVPFSLEFSASAAPVPDCGPLPQATYLLAHPVLGEHLVFLVPIAREGAVARYEAVFNVAKESEG